MYNNFIDPFKGLNSFNLRTSIMNVHKRHTKEHYDDYDTKILETFPVARYSLQIAHTIMECGVCPSDYRSCWISHHLYVLSDDDPHACSPDTTVHRPNCQ